MSQEVTPNILIEAHGLSKRFAGRTILEQVGFSIKQGEVITLVGLNGCGKTTLLRILLGLEAPDGGKVSRKKGLRTGYLPQRFKVDPIFPLDVRSFLELSALDRAIFRKTVEELQISHLLKRSMTALSGGEMQRVMLARALMRKPDILMLDEPVQGVDMSGQAELYQLISNINRQHGCAVMMVSHDLHLVMASTDTVLCLNRHICCSGHPHIVRKDPAFIKLFGDEAARTLALYEHHHDHAHDLRGRVIGEDEVSEGHVHGPHCKGYHHG